MLDKDTIHMKGIIPEHAELLAHGGFMEIALRDVNAIKKWAFMEGSSGVFINGRHGTGKSVIGQIPVIMYLEQGLPARRLAWSELLAQVSANYNKIPHHYYFDKLIFLDDINIYDNKAHIAICDFIKSRLENGVKIIIAGDMTNPMKLGEFGEFIKTSFIPITIQGQNLRAIKVMKEKNSIYEETF